MEKAIAYIVNQFTNSLLYVEKEYKNKVTDLDVDAELMDGRRLIIKLEESTNEGDMIHE